MSKINKKIFTSDYLKRTYITDLHTINLYIPKDSKIIEKVTNKYDFDSPIPCECITDILIEKK